MSETTAEDEYQIDDTSSESGDGGGSAESTSIPEAISIPDDLHDDCSILGVTDVGKTFLLGGMHQSCQLSGSDGYRLTFTPEKSDTSAERATTDLIRAIVERIIDDNPAALTATADVTGYRFTINCRMIRRDPALLIGNSVRTVLESIPRARDFAWRLPKLNYDVNFRVVDGPGGYQFPQRLLTPDDVGYAEQRRMILELRNASRLVICVDASNPRLKEFATGFPLLLEQGRYTSSRFKARRVLLLLTKVDVLVDRFLEAGRDSLERFSKKGNSTFALKVLGGEQTMTPRKLAEILDPVDTARALLGQATVSGIRRSLEDSAQMGIGICSSTGFYPDGQSFWLNFPPEGTAGDGFHMPERNAETARQGPKILPGMTRDDAYRIWTPFGVQEMILFLATGQYGRTIHPYSWRDDATASERKAFPIRLTKPTQAEVAIPIAR